MGFSHQKAENDRASMDAKKFVWQKVLQCKEAVGDLETSVSVTKKVSQIYHQKFQMKGDKNSNKPFQ